MERSDRLWTDGPVFYYDDHLFKPGTDTFLLGAFARTRPGERVCDLGAGTGLLGLLLLARQRDLRLDNVELQSRALALAEKTMAANGFAAGCHLADLRSLEGILPAGAYDLVVSNPPYFPVGSGDAAPSPARRTARQEDCCSIGELCRAAGRLLRWGGRLAVVYRPQRLCDLIEAMRAAGIEPKRLRMVHPAPEKAPSLLLAEGRRGGRPGLEVLPPLILREADGRESRELQEIYFRPAGA